MIGAGYLQCHRYFGTVGKGGEGPCGQFPRHISELPAGKNRSTRSPTRGNILTKAPYIGAITMAEYELQNYQCSTITSEMYINQIFCT